jgi:hypothetical protein
VLPRRVVHTAICREKEAPRAVTKNPNGLNVIARLSQ